MLKVLALIFIINIFSSNAYLEHSPGQKFNFTCSPPGGTLYFKPAKQFSLFLNENLGNKSVQLSTKNINKCILSNVNDLCTFENLTRQIKFTCKQQQQISMWVLKSDIIYDQQQIENSKLVEIIFKNQTRGLIRVDVNGHLAQQISLLPDDIKFIRQLFRYTDCVQDFALFEDQILVSIKKTQKKCLIGLRSFSSDWYYMKSHDIIEVGQKYFMDYINATQNNYEIQEISSKNYSIQFVAQTLNQNTLDILELTMTFIMKNNSQQSFKLKNFEKGLQIFKSKIIYRKQMARMRLKSNLNIFFYMNIVDLNDHQIFMQEDQYLYSSIQSNTSVSLILQLNQFYDQKNQKKKVYMKYNKTQNLNFTFAECKDQLCKNYSNPVKFQDQFIPLCQQLIDYVCQVKIIISSDRNSQMALLPFVPISKIKIQPNTIHKGVLRQEQIYHFYVPKQLLISDQITLEITGAKIFLTYQQSCKRISCCKWRDNDGLITIPKQEKDLFIILKGLATSHYAFSVRTNDKQYILNDGVIFKSKLKPKENEKQYTFVVNDISKSIQINCNSAHQSILLLVNTKQKNFPTLQKYDYKSKNGYIKIEASQLIKDQNVHIKLVRINENEYSTISYSLLAVFQSSPIIVAQNTPFYDFYQINQKKIFEYALLLDSIKQKKIFLKIQFPQLQKNLLNIQIQSQQVKNKFNYTVFNSINIQLDKVIIQSLCKNDVLKCPIFIIIQNFGQNNLQITTLIWIKQQAINLIDGHFLKFETGILGDESHFLIEVQNTAKPVDIYIYSTEVQIEVLTRIWNSSNKNAFNTYPFPSFKELTQQQLRRKTYSYSESIYFSPTQLKKQLGESGLILLTLRDRKLKPKIQVQQRFNRGTLQIVYTSVNNLEMHQDDKIGFSLSQNQTLNIKFDISHLIKQSHQLYFQLTHLLGSALIKVTLQNNNDFVKYNNNELMILDLNELKKNIQNYSKNLTYNLIFTVNCTSIFGRYLLRIITTNSDYRQLIIGVPEQFYLQPKSSIIFQFIDHYNSNFKIKFNRKQGFPSYKIRSCHPNQSQFTCAKQLENRRSQDDPDNLIISGNSHELQINKQNQHYCKGCRYYIAFYSQNTQIEGSVTILRRGIPTLLLQGKTLTTTVQQNNIDYYVFRTPIDKKIEVNIYCSMGDIQLELNSAIMKSYKRSGSSKFNFNIHIEIPATNTSNNVLISIKSKDGQAALYSILINSGLRQVEILDGMLMRYQSKQKSNSTFSYLCETDSNLLINSNVPILVYISCSIQSNVNQIKQNKIELKKKLTSNLISYHLKTAECSKYRIDISSENTASYMILVNGKDIILLPFNIQILTIIPKSKSQIYEIPIQQKTYLNIALQFCQSGTARFGIAEDKKALFQKDYKASFEISENKYEYTFEYAAKPGVFYIQIDSVLKNIQFSIQILVKKFKNQSESIILKSEQVSYSYIRKNSQNKYEYEISFSPLMITTNSNKKYKLTYIVIQSNEINSIKRFTRCRGKVMETFSQSIINQYRIQPYEKQNESNSFFKFQTLLKNSYLSIIPTSNPNLPSYLKFQPYQIIQIRSGDQNLFEKSLNTLISYLRAKLKIQNDKTMQLLLFTIFLFLNLSIMIFCCYICQKKCRRIIIVDRKPSEFQKLQIRQNTSLQLEQKQEGSIELDLYNKSSK